MSDITILVHQTPRETDSYLLSMQSASCAASEEPEDHGRHANVSSETKVTVFTVILADGTLQCYERQASEESCEEHSAAHGTDGGLCEHFVASSV